VGRDDLPTLIVVSGPPATGKTTFATQLAGDLHLPCLSKDAVKEVIFDKLGWTDRAWSVRVGTAAVAIMLNLAERFLEAGCSCLVESNFRPAHMGPDFLTLQARTPFNPVQVLCSCDGPTLVERFAARARSQDRHPGHVDAGNVAEFVPELLVGSYEPLPLDGPVFNLDNTCFDPDAWQRLIEQVRVCLAKPRGRGRARL